MESLHIFSLPQHLLYTTLDFTLLLTVKTSAQWDDEQTRMVIDKRKNGNKDYHQTPLFFSHIHSKENKYINDFLILLLTNRCYI